MKHLISRNIFFGWLVSTKIKYYLNTTRHNYMIDWLATTVLDRESDKSTTG